MRESSYSDHPQNKILVAAGRTVLMSLLLGALFCLDFALYLRAGNILNGAGFNMPVLIAMSYLLVTACALMIITFFSKFLQSLLFAISGTLLAVGFMNQFLQIERSQYLGVLLTSLVGDASVLSLLDGFTGWILLGIIFLLLYILVSQLSHKSLLTLTLILWAFTGTLTLTAMMNGTPKPVLEEVYKSTETTFAENNKTILLLMPNAVSYVALPDNSEKVKLLRNIQLGFMAKYGFKLYPHAYVKNDSRYSNLVEMFNILDTKPYQHHLMTDVGLEKLWKFNTTQKPEVFLKNNQLVEVFQKAHYKVNVYQNRQMETCKKNNQYVADKCQQKTSVPLNVKDFSESDKVELLLSQWISTFDVLYEPSVVSVAEMILDRNLVKGVSLPYEQMYVVQSFQTLKRVLEDVANDTSKAGFYVVYLDFPNNLFVYDEQCRVKPLNKWETDSSKNPNQKPAQKAEAYADQMLCFWNKMEDFMQSLVSLDVYNNVTLIISGVSGGAENSIPSFNFVEQFKKQNTVLFAIHDPQTKFTINHRICSVKDILRTYLFKVPQCKEFDGLGSLETMQNNIRIDLTSNKLTQSDITEALNVYKSKLEKDEDAVQLPKSDDVKFDVTKMAVSEDESEKNEVSEDGLLSDDAVRALTGGEVAVPQPMETKQNDEPQTVEASKDDSSVSEPKDDATQNNEVTEEPKVEEVPLERAEAKVTEKSADKVEEVVTPKEQQPSEPVVEESKDVSSEEQEEALKAVVDDMLNSEETVKEEVLPKQNVQTDIQPVEEKVDVVVEPQKVEIQEVVVPVVSNEVNEIQQVETAPVQEVVVSTVEEVVPVLSVKELEAAPDLNRIIVEQNPVQTEPQTQVPVFVEVQEPQAVVAPVSEVQTEPEEYIHSEIHTDLSGDFLIIEEGEEWEYDPAKALGVSGEESEQQQVIVKFQ